MKKIVVSIFLTLALVLTAAGCGKPQGSQAGVTEIVFETWESLPEQQRTVKLIVEAFEKEHPDIKVTPRFSDQIKIKTEIAGGDAPDCFFWAVEWLRPFVDNNHVVNIRPELEKRNFPFDEYFKKAFDTVEYDGGYYAMPYGVACSGLFYNKSLFDMEGLVYPDENWTWDDYLAAAERLTRDTDGDGEIDQYGCKIPQYLRDYEVKVYGEGLNLISPDLSKALFNDPAVKEQIRWVVDLHLVHNVTTRGAAGESSQEQFKNGKLAMMYDGNYNIDEFNKIDDFEWDVAPTPKGSVRHGNRISAAAVCVSTQTEHLDAAMEFVMFYASEEAQKILGSRKNMIPSLKEAAEEYYAVAPPEHIRVFIDGVEESEFPRYAKTPVSSELESKIFIPTMDKVMQGIMSLDDALDSITIAVDKELQKEE